EPDGSSVEAPDTGDDRVVVRAPAIAVHLEPVLEQPLHVVERVRPVRMACELDGAPDVLVGRLLGKAFELALELLDLRRQPRAAEKVDAAQAREALAQAQLVVSRHSSRTAAGAVQRSRAAPIAARPCRCGRTGSSTRRARSRRAASRASSAARRADLRRT